MSYAVLLYFDPQTEDLIHEWMIMLSEKLTVGELLPSGFRPHLTLTGFEDPPPEGFIKRLETFARKTQRLPITISAVGAFPSEQGVVYLAPVVTSNLLSLHKNFYRMMDGYRIETNEYFTPGNWIPHCTVAYDLNPDNTGRAITTLIEKQLPIFGELVTIGLTEFLPIKELCLYPLAGQS